MHGGGRTFVTVLILALFAPPADASPWQVCGNSGTYTAGSAYQANLNRMADTLLVNISTSPTLFGVFATGALGTGPNQTVYALALCRGDVDASLVCLFCLKSGFRDGQVLCDSGMDVTMFYDICHVRYSNRNFLASTNNSQQHAFFSSSPSLASSVAARFQTFVTRLLNATADYAAVANSTRKFATADYAQDSTRKFATGEMEVDRDYFGGQFDKISSLAQCTPDLTSAQCRACLAAAMSEIPRLVFPSNPRGARVVGERCGLRFDVFPFYDGNPMVRLQVGGPGDKGNGTKAKENGNSSIANISNPSRNGSHPAVLPIVLPVVITLGLISAISICIWRKRSSLKKTQSYTTCSKDIEDIKSVLLDTSVIRIATSNFSEDNKLGEGGFGQVYKGMMPDGQEIAVKRLSEGSKQGLRELKNELLLVAKLQHRNLVKLIGACLNGEDKLLVYEYIPKKSLDAFIFDDEKRGKLVWGTRYKIICGIARGLVYLHDESRIKVIHRDLKPSNILLEMDMNPKISDFGLASIFEGDHTKHITRRVAGTYGYMAPEYAVLGHVSTKSDVFSFGMIILEIVTGRRNSVSSETMMAEHLLTYVWENWTKGTKAEIVDPSLHYNNSSENEVLKCVHIGLLCVQENPGDRPGMSNVMLMLVGKSTTLPAPSRPAFLFRLNDENHAHGGLNNLLDGLNESNPSFNKLTITELQPR